MKHVIPRALAILLAWLALATRASAAERKAADLWLAGPVARIESMEHALSEPLGRLAVDVRVRREEAIDPKTVIDGAATHGEAFARVWIDLSAPARVTLYFVDAAWERILIRHVALEKDFDEVEREEVAQIVRSAVEALLGGAKLGVTREEARAELLPEPTPPSPPRPPPPPEPPPARGRVPAPPVAKPIGVDVGAFYEAEPYAGSLWHGPGLLAGAEQRTTLSWGGRFSLQYRTPTEIEGERLGARLQALCVRALARGAWRSGGFAASAAAGFGLDLTHVQPLSVAGSADADRSSWDAVPIGRVAGGAGIAAAGLWFWPVVGLDVDLVEVHHVGEHEARKYEVFEVSRLRPFLALELVLPAGGD